jgi:Ca-activated chloride channel homolog
MNIRHFLPAFAVLANLVAGWAQQQDPLAKAASTQFSVSVDLVKVPFSVFDDHGNMVQNPRREDFVLYEDNVQQDIRSFGVDVEPVSVVLLLDTSATVKEELKKIKEAAEDFADALSKDDRISIITFDEDVKLLLDWTSDSRLVHRALRRVNLGLRTALYDAMYSAANDMLRGVEGRKAIILLTDGLNNQSSTSFLEASQAIVQSQASLYVVSKTKIVREEARRERRVIMLENIARRLFGDEDYIDEFFKKREEEMSNLAEKTGGRCFFPSDYEGIRGVYGEVAHELKSKHYITYVSNQNKPSDSYHRIVIDYLAPSTKLLYRKGYYFNPLQTYVRPLLKRADPK